MVGEPATTVIEAAERRIQLEELSRRQLCVLLVKLGGADAGASGPGLGGDRWAQPPKVAAPGSGSPKT